MYLVAGDGSAHRYFHFTSGETMKKQTKIQQDGTPRTKGMRNSVVAFATALRGGTHKNSRDKRRAQKARRVEEKAW